MAADPSEIILAGWVEKANPIGLFRKRWLVLTPWTLISYADSAVNALPTKVLDLHQARFELEGDKLFHVVASHRDYRFRAASPTDVHGWESAFARATSGSPAGPPSAIVRTIEGGAGAAAAASTPKPSASAAGMNRSGWVLKKGFVGAWRGRWLVVSPGTLSTYPNSDPGTAPTKVLDLKSVKSLTVKEEETVLVVNTDHRIYEFQFTNDVELKGWHRSVRLAMGDKSGDPWDPEVQSSTISKPAVAAAAAAAPTAVTAEALAKKIPRVPPIIAGWVDKGGVLGTFHKRWVVLYPWCLATYKSNDLDVVPTKVLDLHGAQFSVGEDCVMIIHTPHRAYQFRFSREEELRKWAESFVAATQTL